MFSYLYEWIMNLSFYMVMVTAAMHVVPNSDYKRYIRFFTGLVLVVMLTDPILRLSGAGDLWQNLYDSPVYREQVEKMERAAKYFEGMSDDFGAERENPGPGKGEGGDGETGSTGNQETEEEEGAQIHVDEIRIGR